MSNQHMIDFQIDVQLEMMDIHVEESLSNWAQALSVVVTYSRLKMIGMSGRDKP